MAQRVVLTLFRFALTPLSQVKFPKEPALAAAALGSYDRAVVLAAATPPARVQATVGQVGERSIV